MVDELFKLKTKVNQSLLRSPRFTGRQAGPRRWWSAPSTCSTEYQAEPERGSKLLAPKGRLASYVPVCGGGYAPGMNLAWPQQRGRASQPAAGAARWQGSGA